MLLHAARLGRTWDTPARVKAGAQSLARAPLVHHRPGQPLFMQAAEHTTEQPTAPDIVTYLYQHNTSPWGPGLIADHQPIDTTGIPVDELVARCADS